MSDFDSTIAKFTPRQMEAIKVLDSGKIKYLLYGGALGGGKSYLLRWYAARRLMVLAQLYRVKKANIMLACEDYPSLKDRQLQKISVEFPPYLGTMHQDHKEYGRCFMLNEKWGGGVICFRNLDDTSKYQSAEFSTILVDELTKNTLDTFTFLRTRLRWPGIPDVECQFVGATNPGGIGHGWVKQLWIDRAFGEEWKGYEDQFAFVQSLADDNPYLDESYWRQLDTLPEHLRRAFRHGDWNIFYGQAFPEFSTRTHVIDCAEPPKNAPLYMTFDWGFGKPFSVGWWWVDQDGRIYRFSEWYGWNGTADQGLRLPDSSIAEGIVDREKALGIHGRNIIRLCDPTCMNKKPDYKGGGQGPSTAEEFARYRLFMTPGDANRELKLRQFRERLRLRSDGDGKEQRPMMYVDRSCVNFIRTIQSLVMCDHRIEEVDTTGEDHVYDEACHVCMARPMGAKIRKKSRSLLDAHIERLERGGIEDEYERYMALQNRQFESDMVGWEGFEEYGGTIPTDGTAIT